MRKNVLALDPRDCNLFEYRINLLLFHAVLRSDHAAKKLHLPVELPHHLLAARVQADDLLFERSHEGQQLPPVDELVAQPRRAGADVDCLGVGSLEHGGVPDDDEEEKRGKEWGGGRGGEIPSAHVLHIRQQLQQGVKP